MNQKTEHEPSVCNITLNFPFNDLLSNKMKVEEFTFCFTDY